MTDSALFAQHAAPVLELADLSGNLGQKDVRPYLNEAKTRLDRFEEAVVHAGSNKSSAAAARYALLVILDSKARANPALPIKHWAAGAHSVLFEGRDVNLGGLKELQVKAQNAGQDYKGIGAFLGHCIDRVEAIGSEALTRTHRPRRKLGIVVALGAVCILAGALALYQTSQIRAVSATLAPHYAEATSIRIRDVAVQADKLDSLRDAVTSIIEGRESSPLGFLDGLGVLSPSKTARQTYSNAVKAVLPRQIVQVINLSLAKDEDGLAVYDSLRARSIMEGRSAWSSHYLANWLAQNSDLSNGSDRLATHIYGLQKLENYQVPVNPELLADALDIAKETTATERAYLELSRLDQFQDIASLDLSAEVRGLTQIVQRRSRQPLKTPIPSRFTLNGWTFARDTGIQAAIAMSRQETALVFGTPDNEPVASEALLERLQIETNQYWTDVLNDLEVRPFDDQRNSILITGQLGTPNNPLTRLFRLLWDEVGGNDRQRSHENQLAVAIAFGPLIQYVEKGKMGDVSQLFSDLNVAIASLSPDDEVSSRRLMNVNARARSISALAAAPVLVSQIVEDVLARASSATLDKLKNPAQLEWDRELSAQCRATLTDAYPFEDGADLPLDRFAGFFGFGGVIDRFERGYLAQLLDRSEQKWRWKPEARFAGFSRDTAEFFQQAFTLRESLFTSGIVMEIPIIVTSLGQSGRTEISIGGQRANVSTDAAPAQFIWPGDQPERGMSVAMTNTTGRDIIAVEGDWGFLRLLDSYRLRPRDEGKRYRVDLKGETGRLFADIEFSSPLNPVSLRKLFGDMKCPPTL